MLGNLRIDQFAAMRPQPCQRPFLVRAHEPAVTGDIRGKNGGQLAFDAFRGQSGLPPHGPNGSSALSAFYALGPRLPFPFGGIAGLSRFAPSVQPKRFHSHPVEIWRRMVLTNARDRSGVAGVDIAAWLNRLGFEQYEQAFRGNDIDGEVLRE